MRSRPGGQAAALNSTYHFAGTSALSILFKNTGGMMPHVRHGLILAASHAGPTIPVFSLTAGPRGIPNNPMGQKYENNFASITDRTRLLLGQQAVDILEPHRGYSFRPAALAAGAPRPWREAESAASRWSIPTPSAPPT
jgi:hypothetical protein